MIATEVIYSAPEANISHSSSLMSEARPVPAQQFSEDEVDQLVKNAAKIRKDIDSAARHCSSLEKSLAQLESAKGAVFEEDAPVAMALLVGYIKHIESLYILVQDKKKRGASQVEIVETSMLLMNASKSYSREVLSHFESLRDKAKDVMDKSSELSTKFKSHVTLTQTQVDKLHKLEETAKAMRSSIEDERKALINHMKEEEEHIKKAEAAKRSAVDDSHSLGERRIVRDVLTLGIGEVFDFGGLNKRYEKAQRLIKNIVANMEECKRSVQRAKDALARTENEVKSLEGLRTSVNSQEETLQNCIESCNELHKLTIKFANVSVDVSVFLGILTVKSDKLDVSYTAQDFARNVLRFGKMTALEEKLEGLLLDSDPGALQETLDMIAQCDGSERDRAVDDTCSYCNVRPL